MANKKFIEYENLRKALGKTGIANSGKVAALLLEVFLEQKKFGRPFCKMKGLCLVPGEFKALRNSLIEGCWIEFELLQGKYAQYSQGIRLIPYLNREKLKGHALVSLRELKPLATKKELNVLRKETFDEFKVIKKELYPPI